MQVIEQVQRTVYGGSAPLHQLIAKHIIKYYSTQPATVVTAYGWMHRQHHSLYSSLLIFDSLDTSMATC